MTDEKEILKIYFKDCNDCQNFLEEIGTDNEQKIYRAMNQYHNKKSNEFKKKVIDFIMKYERKQFDLFKLIRKVNEL